MKRMLFVLSGILAVGVASIVGQTNAVEQEIMKLEQTLGDATIKKDRATLERVFAADYMYTHSNGVVMNKAEEITDTMSGDSQWTAAAFSDLKVRVFGDVAIVTGVETLRGKAKGYVSGPRRITDLFVRRDGRWQMVGGQTTLVPQK
jgi:ketosteroid isomerase-like protein